MKIEDQLDYVLVPLGVSVMVAYHLWLVYNIVRHPNNTAIGVNSINRQHWVQAMLEDTVKNGICAVQTLRNNIMASTVLASTTTMLTSVVAVLMTNAPALDNGFMYGNKSELGVSIKLFSILACIFLSLLSNVQSIRCYSEASMLINMAGRRNPDPMMANYIGRMVNMGSYFWSLGLRSFYFSFPMFMWLFGPIPMFLCSVLMVTMLYVLDIYFGPRNIVREAKDEENDTK